MSSSANDDSVRPLGQSPREPGTTPPGSRRRGLIERRGVTLNYGRPLSRTALGATGEEERRPGRGVAWPSDLFSGCHRPRSKDNAARFVAASRYRGTECV
jgi:hypothetical protein